MIINLWNIWVSIRYLSPFEPQDVHNFKGRRLPNIINILFISDAKNMDIGAFYALFRTVQRISDLFYNKFRHSAIYLVCKRNKSQFKSVLFCNPGKIQGVNGNTVAAQSRTRIK